MQPPDELLDNRSDPDARMVLEDFERSHGWMPTRLGLALSFLHAAAAADADAAAAADADAAAARAKGYSKAIRCLEQAIEL